MGVGAGRGQGGQLDQSELSIVAGGPMRSQYHLQGAAVQLRVLDAKTTIHVGLDLFQLGGRAAADNLHTICTRFELSRCLNLHRYLQTVCNPAHLDPLLAHLLDDGLEVVLHLLDVGEEPGGGPVALPVQTCKRCLTMVGMESEFVGYLETAS